MHPSRPLARLAVLTLLLGGCSLWQKEPSPAPQSTHRMTLKQTAFSALPGWQADDQALALKTFQRSCEKIANQPSTRIAGNGRLAAPLSVWQAPCRNALALRAANSVQARQFFESHFTPFIVTDNGNEQGLFTGYFEPQLNGSAKRSARYRYPLYHAPEGLKDGRHDYSRAEVEAGALAGKGLEFLWVDDAVDLYFLQVQGSGRVKLENGTVLRIGFAGKNSHEYVSLGKIMDNLGVIPKGKINYFTMRDWMKANPKHAHELMLQNPRYVYFHELKGQGPIGGSGVALTPLRSLAVDTGFIPYPAPLYLMTTLPETQMSAGRAFNQLMIAQDTGSAIKNPVRGDVFFGAGPQAEAWAGHMTQRGSYAILLPKALAAQVD
jgi:membrane-bound lytic murein transglycosylase A